MENKQIIIDGVNISKCKHYDEVFNYCDQSYLGEGGLLKNTKNPKRCECSPNCYYKQLKRKEQECEELRKRLESFQKDYSKLYQVVENKGYIKELDQLKAELEQEKALRETYLTCYKAKHEDITGKLFKYKQTLAEIKEIAEENIRIADLEGLNGVYRRGLAKQILQKISEI